MIAGLSGDSDAYRQLLAALTRHLRAYYLKRVGSGAAEDLVQETLIAIHTRRGTYDAGQPFTSWVFGIARYKLIDEYRREKRRAAVPLDEATDLFAHDESEAATARRDVQKLLAKLPEAKRRLVQATQIDGRSVGETADASALSESAVKVTVHRALKSLGQEIGGDDANR